MYNSVEFQPVIKKCTMYMMILATTTISMIWRNQPLKVFAEIESTVQVSSSTCLRPQS